MPQNASFIDLPTVLIFPWDFPWEHPLGLDYNHVVIRKLLMFNHIQSLICGSPRSMATDSASNDRERSGADSCSELLLARSNSSASTYGTSRDPRDRLGSKTSVASSSSGNRDSIISNEAAPGEKLQVSHQTVVSLAKTHAPWCSDHAWFCMQINYFCVCGVWTNHLTNLSFVWQDTPQ